jgi:V8-like Glu-specific endopeptidase
MSLLSPQTITEIKQFFTATQTPYDAELRSLLFNGVNFQFIQSLKNFANPGFQLSGDLGKLDSTERLADGTTPFETWLKNAAELLSHLDTTKVFNRALDELTTRMTSATPIVDPANVPKVFEVKEAIVQRDDMVSYGFLFAGLKAGEAVARLQVPRHDNGTPAKLPSGALDVHVGTGWLLANDLILTNHHVINARRQGEATASAGDLALQAQNTTVQFDYDAETMAGTILNVSKLEASDADLDYAVLRLKEPIARAPLTLNRTKLEVAKDDYLAVNIIQHPFGGPKKVAIRNNLIYDSKFPKLRYFTDTEHGSSGSPVLNDSWQVVALHRASAFVEDVKFQGRLTGWVNEGTQITAILEDLKDKNAEVYQAIAV